MAKSGQSSKSPDCMCLTISAIRLGNVLDIVKVLKFAFLRNDTFPRAVVKIRQREKTSRPRLYREGPAAKRWEGLVFSTAGFSLKLAQVYRCGWISVHLRCVGHCQVTGGVVE
jgi:hypothetical protein